MNTLMHNDPHGIIEALMPLAIMMTPIGSRVTCNPVPVGTDEDWLVLLAAPRKRLFGAPDDHVREKLKAFGFRQDGSPEFYTGSDAGGFRSWRRGDLNLVTTSDPEFHDRFLTATHLAKRFNLLVKADRIALFQAVLYGVDARNLELPADAGAPRAAIAEIADMDLPVG